MKDKDYRFLQTKYKLRELKNRRVKDVTWRLTREQREYIERLGYKIVPCLYEVKTRTFTNISNIKNSKLKELHYSYKKGKKAIVLNLNNQDIKALEDYSVKFRPIKFKIILIS